MEDIMYKNLIKKYVDSMSKDDIKKYASMNDYIVSDKDIDIIYKTIKENFEDLYNGDVALIFLNLKEQLEPDTFILVKNLYEEAKNKLNL